MSKREVEDATTSIAGALTDLGCQYDCEFDNRGGNRSNYIFVRKPVPAKIRIADHPSSRMDKDKGRAKVLVIDVNVGPRKFGVTWQEAVAQIAATV
jgi:hypothetical protein